MRQRFVSWLLVSLGIAVGGCSQQAAPPASAPGPAPAAAQSEEAAIGEALAKLSETDRAAAVKQDVCPVGGGKLGSMGVPPKITVEGQEVFLCCSGCEEVLRAEPAKYLAKLKTK